MKKVFIHQPDFIPWLGYFKKLYLCDEFIILDDVQFNRRGFTHRDKILTSDGPSWLTIPIKKKGNFKTNINQVLIDNSTNWKKKHLNSLFFNYKQSLYFEENFVKIEKIYEQKFDKLIDFNIKTISIISKILTIPKKKQLFSSSLNIKEKKNEKIINLLKKVDAKIYLTGNPSMEYLNLADFEKNNINISIIDDKLKIYKQNSKKFYDKISSLDFIFNCVGSNYNPFKKIINVQ